MQKATMRGFGEELKWNRPGPVLVSSAKSIRVLLLNDQALVRAALRILIESWPGFQVVADGGRSDESLALAAKEKPDIILLDLDLGRNGDGLDFLRQLRNCTNRSRIIILTAMPEAQMRLRAVRLGAMGVVLKEKAAEELRKAIEKVHAGELWLDRMLTASIIAELSNGSGSPKEITEEDRIASLTDREREIATAVCQGLRNEEVASRLSITETTVRHHLTAIFNKLEVSNRFELIIFLYRNKFVRPPL